MKVLTDAEYAEAVSLCRYVVEAASSFDGGPMVAGHFLGKLRDLLAPPVIRGAPMSAPEPSTGTQDLAEKVARARHAATYQAVYGWPSWDDSPSPYRSEALRHAGEHLAAMAAAGLAVVELPETVLREERINGIGLEIEVPALDGRRREVTGWHFPGYDEDRVGLGELGWRSSLADARVDAARILAACDAVERLRAEHQGGEPQ